jgi:serine/threonine protein kinase
LKSDNILVDFSGTCKISDFGISKKASEMTRVGKAYTSLKGTIYWMAPEVLSSTGEGYDVKVDIWSVGCVAVEMWTGKRPWHPLPFPAVMIEVRWIPLSLLIAHNRVDRLANVKFHHQSQTTSRSPHWQTIFGRNVFTGTLPLTQQCCPLLTRVKGILRFDPTRLNSRSIRTSLMFHQDAQSN